VSALTLQGVATIRKQCADLRRFLASLLQRDGAHSAKPHLAPLPIPRPTVDKNPALAAVLAGRNPQVEPTPVGIHSRSSKRLHLPCAEKIDLSSHCFRSPP